MTFEDISKNKKEKFVVKSPGKHVFFMFNRSGKLHIDIAVAGAEVYIFGLFVGKKSDRFIINTVQQHRVGNSVSDLLIKGVFFDDSKFIYEGLIRIEKAAQKSNAYQKNQNLVMSPEVFIDSRPFLEILANDVRCTHGSTTGQLDVEQIYYARTRGVNQKKAKDLLIEGFINDVFSKIRELGVEDAIASSWSEAIGSHI